MDTGALACWIVLLPLLGFAFNALSGYLIKDPTAQKKAVAIVAPGVAFAAFLLALALFPAMLAAPAHRLFAPLIPGTSLHQHWISMGGFTVDFTLLIDPLSLLMALVVTGVGGLIHVYATGYMAADAEQPRFFTYFNLFLFMMLLLVMANSFLLMFVGWEGVGTCSYLLISFWYRDTDNAKAGNKAFIVNRVGDLGFALGMMAAWSVFGTVSFFTANGHGIMDLAAHAGGAIDVTGHTVSVAMLTLICLLLFVGAIGKSAQIPLFVWLPDAMAGPTPVSALIHAATMVTAGVVMLTRCSWLFVQAPAALHVVAWVGAITALMGATIGLVQTDIKKVLAYSTISQLGYMFIACGVGAFSAGMFHVLTHAFFKALLFLGSGAVIHSMLGEQDMRKMGGLRKYIPRVWLVMAIGTYTIAGVPPLSGFWSKDPILEAASRSSYGDGILLYGIGLFTAFLTAFYMNRMMWKTFYTDPRFTDGQLPELNHSNEEHVEEAHEAPHGHIHQSPPSMMVPLYILAALSVVAGLILGPTHIFENFLQPSVAPLSMGHLVERAALFPSFVGYVLSILVAVAGLALAYMLYRQHMADGQLVPQERENANPLYRILAAKWGFDALYERVFIQFGGAFSRNILWHSIDENIIDGFIGGLAGMVRGLSRVGRRIQTGYVRSYAMAMLLGMAILVIALAAGLMKYGAY